MNHPGLSNLVVLSIPAAIKPFAAYQERLLAELWKSVAGVSRMVCGGRHRPVCGSRGLPAGSLGRWWSGGVKVDLWKRFRVKLDLGKLLGTGCHKGKTRVELRQESI